MVLGLQCSIGATWGPFKFDMSCKTEIGAIGKKRHEKWHVLDSI